MRVGVWSGLALLGILMAYGLPGASAGAGPTVNVSTESPGYLPGATVTVQGSVTLAGAPVAGADVALEADGATSGQTYWVDQVTTGGNGDFTDTFILPSAAAQESEIKIYAVSGAGRASTTFQVETPPAPSGGGSEGASSSSASACTDQPGGEVINSQMGSQGGTLTSTDGCIVLTVPAGAFSQTTTITVTESAPGSLPPGDETAIAPLFAIDFGGEAAQMPIGAEIFYSAKTVGTEPVSRIGLFLQDGAYYRYIKDTASAATNSDTSSITAAGSYVLTVNTQSFSDIQSGVWPQQEIDVLLGRDAVSGFPDGGFHPDGTVTRAQFVKMLVLALGLQLPQTPTSGGFTDVDPSAWYAPYVDAAVTAGFIKGVTAETFEPDASITRAQLAVIIYRAMNGYTPASPLAVQFTDQSQIPSWALQAVMATAQAGIVRGLPSGAFDPAGFATRGDAAGMVGNLVTVTNQ